MILTPAILLIGVLAASGSEPTNGDGMSVHSGVVTLTADTSRPALPHSTEGDGRAKTLQQGLQQLGLSKKQIGDIAKITAEFRNSVEPLAPRAQALARERMNLVNQGAEKDKPRIVAIDEEIRGLRERIVQARSALQAKLMGILTPEQRVKFERIMQESTGNRQHGSGSK